MILLHLNNNSILSPVPESGYSVPESGYSRNVWFSNNSTLSVPESGYSVPELGYCRNASFSDNSTLRVPESGYSRNASCVLNLISMFLLEQLFCECVLFHHKTVSEIKH